MANVKTITLGGAEQKVIISGQNCDIRNDGAEVIYASAKPDIVAGADGVVSIPIGQAVKLLDTRGTVYLLGTGVVQLCGNDYGYLVFKCAPAGGGSGTQDDVARIMASANAASIAELKTDVSEVQTVATNISNPNLLINPDFKINQRGQTSYNTTGYTVDRWRIDGNTSLSVADDGKISIDRLDTTTAGEFFQLLEYDFSALAGRSITLSETLDDGEKHTITGTVAADEYTASTNICTMYIPINGAYYHVGFKYSTSFGRFIVNLWIPTASGITTIDNIAAIKLELGSVATPFVPSDPATELAKCQRYYQIHTIGDIDPVDLRPSMRIAPTVTQLADRNYAYSAEL